MGLSPELPHPSHLVSAFTKDGLEDTNVNPRARLRHISLWVLALVIPAVNTPQWCSTQVWAWKSTSDKNSQGEWGDQGGQERLHTVCPGLPPPILPIAINLTDINEQ